MKHIVLYTFASLVFLGFFHGNPVVATLGSANAQQDWKQEYAAVCAKTQNAMNLSSEELRDYVDRCDKLQDRINELNGSSEKKVYAKRLKMCRDLYKYVLDYKNKEK